MSEKQKNKDKDSAPVYKSGYGNALKNNLAKVMEKKNFSYDADKDKLFSQYKNSYEKSGRTAMRDTMGNAASLTADMATAMRSLQVSRRTTAICQSSAIRYPNLNRGRMNVIRMMRKVLINGLTRL